MIILKYRGSAYIRGCQPDLRIASETEANDRSTLRDIAVRDATRDTIDNQCQWPQPLKYRGISYLLLNHWDKK